MFGLRSALLPRSQGEDNGPPDNGVDSDFLDSERARRDVDSLEQMMSTLLAVREQNEGLPLAQRRQMAARAVRDLMQSQ